MKYNYWAVISIWVIVCEMSKIAGIFKFAEWHFLNFVKGIVIDITLSMHC